MPKFTLPHDATAIAAAESAVEHISQSLRDAQCALEDMTRANSAVERAEEVRKARIMTPTMLAALKRLANKEIIVAWHSYGNRPARHHWDDMIGERVNSSLYERFLTAGFITHNGRITDAGREALAKASEA